MAMQQIKLTGFSTALFSSWYFLEEYGILFDAGDGVTAHLLQKAGKIRHIFISHADRDHITGLLQLLQLNGHAGNLRVYYPKDSGSFPYLKDFSEKFDPHVPPSTWIPLDDETEIEIKQNLFVRAFRNEHIPVEQHIIKSLSFELFRRKRKLKAEFQGRSGKEIEQLRHQHGQEYITYSLKENLLFYSADTPVDDYSKWENANILIHEATFLNQEGVLDLAKFGKHSVLKNVLKMAAEVQPKALVLGHFSKRYSDEIIIEETQKWVEEYQLQFPIYWVLPGKVNYNILQL